MDNIISFPSRKKIRQQEKRRSFLISLIPWACFIIVALFIISDADSQSLDEYGLATSFLPPVETPSSDVPVEPMPPVVNQDQGAQVSDIAPDPVIVNEGSAPCIGELCNIETPSSDVPVQPMPGFINPDGTPWRPCFPGFELYPGWFNFMLQEICNVFPDHLTAEVHQYHCREGIALWGSMIKAKEPLFEPVLSLDDIKPNGPCQNDSFEIYPDSNLCSLYPDHRETERNYRACRTTNFQYWDRLQQLNAAPSPTPVPPLACNSSIKFGQGGSVWKARSENTGAPVLVLDKAVCGRIANTRVEDVLGATLASGEVRYGSGCRAETNQGRYHEDFKGLRGVTGTGFLKFDLDGVAQCIRIPELSKDVR